MNKVNPISFPNTLAIASVSLSTAVNLTCLNAFVDDFYLTEPLHTGNT